MNKTIRYVSHTGQEFTFDRDGGYRIADSNHKDYSVGYSTMGGELVGFNRGVGKIPFSIVTKGKDAKLLRDRFYEAADGDVISEKPGRIYDGDFFIDGYFISSKKSDWFNDYYCVTNVEFLSVSKFWIRERTKAFTQRSSNGLDYPHDFSFDFASTASADTITNESFAPSLVRITIQGAAQNPSVTIGGNEYRVDVNLQTGEYLEIDPLEKTIEVVTSTGQRTNVFDKRHGVQVLGSGSYIFEKIPVGELPVLYSNGLTFSVTVIEQRAEPRWT